jgi:DNA mismatch repair protein MutS2
MVNSLMMDEKTLQTLEFPKILERLAGYAAFSASADLVRALQPTSKLDEALTRLARTTEARLLLSVNDTISVGGAHDVRAKADLAMRGGVLDASDLIDIKGTLIAARELARTFEHQQTEYPRLSKIAVDLVPPPGVVDTISRTISDRGEVLDSASPKLAQVRREIKVSFDRLMTRLERMVNDPRTAPMLQEGIITQRNGRYVIPLRAEFKGRVKSIVHDQSASGATLFVEPLVIVDLNNEWHRLQLEERDEVRRILAELSGTVGAYAERIRLNVQALAEFDLTLACAKYAEDMHATEPLLEPIKNRRDQHPGTTVKLYQVRHPLLDPASVVPIDVDLDENTFVMVITGPNTGGKTVTLKAVGLMALMAQSGLHIPAQSGSTLSLFHEIYADIGDEQSIEQSLSTFSGHITNIIHIMRRANAHSLVLLDELGAGTDPQEGSALARSILIYLIERRITCMVATHYPELKAFAHATPGVINASMEFDLRSLRPTYHLTLGLPGRSNALQIAERLGLPVEVIESARGTLDPNDLKAEDLLDEIHRQRDIARKARSAADRMRSESERLRAELTLRLEKIEDERQAVLTRARAEAEQDLVELHNELDDVRKELARARQPIEALRAVQDKVEDMQERVGIPVERKVTEMSGPRPLKLGDKVRVRSLQMEGVVSALSESEIEVQLGNLRVRARVGDIQRAGEPIEPPEPTPSSVRLKPASAEKSSTPAAVFRSSPGMELDLRGQRAEDALDALERYLESAYLAGLPFVRIIHGKGTGKLRQVIREALHASPHVTSFESGRDNEGGDGVTVAKLA